MGDIRGATIVKSGSSHILSNPELAKRLHVHTIANTPDAHKITCGVIDVELIEQAGLSVPDELRKNPSVNVSIHSFAMNPVNGHQDAIFSAFDPSTRGFIGHYMSGAFKSLSPQQT